MSKSKSINDEELLAAPILGSRHFNLSGVKTPNVGESRPNLEGLNLEIVELLREDGRATFSSIAEKLGVSESTVRTRVSRMRNSNVIHFITVTNPLPLGHSAWAMLGICVCANASAKETAEYFRDLKEVVYAMRVAGRFDLLAEIVVETPDDLREFLDNHCYSSQLIASVEPMIGLGLYKSLYKWEKPLAPLGK